MIKIILNLLHLFLATDFKNSNLSANDHQFYFISISELEMWNVQEAKCTHDINHPWMQKVPPAVIYQSKK